MRRLAVLLCLLPWAARAAPSGQDIVLHGNSNGALPCAACHGVNGAGKPATGAPALAGRPEGEIEAELAAMAQGKGGNALMRSIAHALSPAEAEAVAAYFAALPKP
ncbi:c-type cytochrome [Acidocella sp. KAb 2-4]|uniref:c-type cytochrome n=1 Tax=Acidocella sp. KAb 2-4 TaxID=2885158 RepID=UPI001D089377|nr:c-type cytochrome [Acidocella sp. KAb 2-4]